MMVVKVSMVATDITFQISLTLKNLVPDHSVTCGNHVLIVSISFFIPEINWEQAQARSCEIFLTLIFF